MQISPTSSSIFIASSSGQIAASSANKHISRVEFKQGDGAREKNALQELRISKQLLARPSKSQVPSVVRDITSASNQPFRSIERLLNPLSHLPASARNAVNAYETTSRLEERNQLNEALGFDAFA